MKHFLLCLLLLLGADYLSATHFMGGSITYEQISPCVYRIYTTTYLDCGASIAIVGPGNNPASPFGISMQAVVCQGTASAPVQIGAGPTHIHYIEVTPVCPSTAPPALTQCDGTNPGAPLRGVAESKYYYDYDFCNTNCTEFIIGHSNCCRNPYTTFTLQGGQDMHYSTHMTLGNSSPVFDEEPQLYICLGDTTFANFSATDPDGDSLVYELVNCYQNPGISAVYQLGYTPQQALGPYWNMNLDSHTGLLTILPNPNGSMEVGVVCMLVKEYRAGQLLASVQKEFQLTVIDCVLFPNEAPVHDTIYPLPGPGLIPNSDTFLIAPGDTLRMAVGFRDADVADSIFVEAVAPDLANFTWTPSAGNPSLGVLEWIADSSFLGLTVPVLFFAKDNHCPKPIQTLFTAKVKMVPFGLTGIIIPAACGDSIGLIDLHISGGTPPFSVLWSSGETTADIDSLLPGLYQVTVTDAAGLQRTGDFVVPGLDFILNANMVSPTCTYGNDGWIEIAPQSPNGPFTYLWSNGQTTDSATNLSPGLQSVLVEDNTGCVNQWVGNLLPSDSCHVYVSGTVYHDANANCMMDPGESPFSFVLVDINPGGAVMTDSLGNYQFELDTGAYTLSISNNTLANIICPPSSTHNLVFDEYEDDTTGIDFGLDLPPSQDFGLFYSIPYPGLVGAIRSHRFFIRNYGNAADDAIISLQIDLLEKLETNPVYPMISADSSLGLFRWLIPPINAGNSQMITINTRVKTIAHIGDTLYSEAVVFPSGGDNNLSNNRDSLAREILAPYDPNDMLVSPKGQLAQGYISSDDSVLTYTVRFQNVGNAPAQLVVIRDTIDSDLDALQFQPLGYSFPYLLQVEADSILVFSFPAINLPDSASDPAGSQGFVQYSLPHRGTLAPFTEITNRAAIYFDYNAPIITNTVLNTIYLFPEVGIREDTLCSGGLLFAELSVPGVAPYDFVWSTGDQGTALPIGAFGTVANATGWYSLTVTDSNGFETTDSVYTIVSAQSPTAAFSVTQGGLDITLANLSQDGLSYQWDFGDGASSQDSLPNHVYAASGLYTLRLIVTNACGSDTISQTLSVIATALEEEFRRSVKLMPNPFETATELHFSNPNQKKYDLYIYDLSGKLVRSYYDNRETRFVIKRAELSAGMYLYQLIGESSCTGKFMIK
ncbi:MAG: PKD domain-containing protein [Bacteroidia bacterium]